MADKVLNWGLLSTAKINRALIQPLREAARCRLLAVASRSLSSAQEYARAWDIPRAYGAYDDLLNDPDVHVVYNPLPNHLHAEWTIKALQAGKHVLCEKPLALSLEEADAMRAAAHKSGKILTEAFMYRHHAQTLKVKEIAASGALGKIQLVKGAFAFTLTREGNFRFFKETGGGSLWDVGCYPVSYARMILGEPEEVFGWQLCGAGGSDELFCGQIKFPDGGFAQFDCGFKSPLRTCIEIVGGEASLYVPNPFKPGRNNEIFLRRGEREERIPIKGGELYLGEVEDLRDAILLGKPPRISLEDSRANLAALLALLQSAQTGKPVPLNS